MLMDIKLPALQHLLCHILHVLISASRQLSGGGQAGCTKTEAKPHYKHFSPPDKTTLGTVYVCGNCSPFSSANSLSLQALGTP